MKKLVWCLLVVMLIVPAAGVYAQDGDTQSLNYGDTVSGEISNRTFEVIYTFEGKAEDLISISMTSIDGGFDTFLYLTTLDNEILAQNDDFGSYTNSTIVSTLENDGTYQIVATRYNQRGGSGEGSYTLSLDTVRSAELGVTIEGSVSYGTPNQPHIFTPTTSGTYTFSYTHVRGDYHPSVVVNEIDTEYGWNDEVAMLSGSGLQNGQFSIALEGGAIYGIVLQDNYYDYNSSEGDSAIYTVVIQQQSAAPTE